MRPRCPEDLAALSAYDAVFLVDVPAEALPGAGRWRRCRSTCASWAAGW